MKTILLRFTTILLLCTLALSLVASAAEVSTVTPSVEAKDAPELVGEINEYGENIIADIIDIEAFENGTFETVKDVSDIKLIITPYSERYEVKGAFSEEAKNNIRKFLEEAFREVSGYGDLGDLCADLDELVKLIDTRLDTSVLVAYQLFDLTLVDGEEKQILSLANRALRVTFTPALYFEAGTKPIVLHKKVDTGEWILVPDEKVILNEDNTLTVIFDSLCPVLVLKYRVDEDENYVLGNGTVVVPDTGDKPVGIFLALAAVAIAISAFALSKKTKKVEE